MPKHEDLSSDLQHAHRKPSVVVGTRNPSIGEHKQEDP